MFARIQLSRSSSAAAAAAAAAISQAKDMDRADTDIDATGTINHPWDTPASFSCETQQKPRKLASKRLTRLAIS